MSLGDWIKDALKLLQPPGSAPGTVGASVSVPVTTTFSAPVTRPPAIPHPSPNFHRTAGRRPVCVVIHATESANLQSPLAWLCDPKSKVSAHYLIDKSGMVYQLVHEEDVAWHAGVSYWMGKPNVNAFSVGIELVNRNDGLDPYPEPQLATCAQLVKAMCSDYAISPMDVVGHADIAPGRKTDPGAAFPWQAFRARLA